MRPTNLMPVLFTAFFVVWTANSLTCVADTLDDPNSVLMKLGEQYKNYGDEFEVAAKQVDERLSDEDWLRSLRQIAAEHPSVDSSLVPKFLEFAKQHKDSPFAFDALAFVIQRGGRATLDVQSKEWNAKETAVDLFRRNHMDEPRATGMLNLLSGCVPSVKTEACLRAACKSTDEKVRAEACLSLARYLRTALYVVKRSEDLKQQSPQGFQRFWKVVLTPYI